MSKDRCTYSHPVTYGDTCGAPAEYAGAKESEYTADGTYWALRCANCMSATGPDNLGVRCWEQFIPSKHVNNWK